MSSRRFGRAWAPLVLVALSALVLGPMLWSRGYALVADMTFVPEQPWKSTWLGLDGSLPRAVPADAFVSVIGQAVPGDLLQKAILLGTLVLAGLGMLQLAGRLPGVGTGPRLGAAVLYLWNPYVYERLAIGHWGLLIGYAALPWVVAAALDVRPSAVRRDTGSVLVGPTARLVLWLALAAAGSPTGGLVAGVVALVVAFDRRRLRRSLAVIGAVVLVNLPWLVPGMVNGSAPSDGSGVTAFASRADSPLGVWGSLLTLGGIWKAAAVPSERGVTLLVVVAFLLVASALVALARADRRLEDHPARRLLVLALLAVLVAGLPATGLGERLVTHVVEASSGAGLWRDSQKWLMPFVLVASWGIAALLGALDHWLRRHRLPAGAAIGALALLPVVLLPSLAWGLSGRLSPVDYPDEWRAVRTILDRQPVAGRRTAVLPWSAYQRFRWNDQRAALDPALRFFPGQVVANDELTLGDHRTVRGQDPAGSSIGQAIADGRPIGPALATAGVRYLLVERTAPSAVEVALPSGTVLHDGPELLLLDLGTQGRSTRSPHPHLIVTADVLAGSTVLVAALLTGFVAIRRRQGPGGGNMAGGSSTNGEVADYR